MNSIQDRVVDTSIINWKPALLRHEIVSGSNDVGEYWEIPHGVDTQYLSHSYFRYIGKFPPQIARFFVQELCPEKGLVIDAMCGGGTTLTESVLSGRRVIGFDVNPVSRQISRTVSRSVDPIQLSIAVENVLKTISKNDSLFSLEDKGSVKLLDLADSDHFFSEEAKIDLAIAVQEIRKIRLDEIQDFLMTAVMSVLRQVSLVNVKKMNVVIDDTRRNHKNLNEALNKKLTKMSQVNEEMNLLNLSEAKVIDHDATLPWPTDPETADLVVLHPPYLTNTAFSEFTRLQLALIGIEHKKIWKRELRNRGSYIHEPNGLKKYLIGWHRSLENAYKSLKKGGKCAVVVGDGKIEFARIPVGAITQEFARDIGFSVEYTAEHLLNNNTGLTLTQKMKGQHVIILNK